MHAFRSNWTESIFGVNTMRFTAKWGELEILVVQDNFNAGTVLLYQIIWAP